MSTHGIYAPMQINAYELQVTEQTRALNLSLQANPSKPLHSNFVIDLHLYSSLQTRSQRYTTKVQAA